MKVFILSHGPRTDSFALCHVNIGSIGRSRRLESSANAFFDLVESGARHELGNPVSSGSESPRSWHQIAMTPEVRHFITEVLRVR